MKKNLFIRLLSMLLAVALCAGLMPTAFAAEQGGLTVRQVDNSSVSADLRQDTAVTEENQPQYADTEYVRVSIVLEQASAVEAGFELSSIARDQDALAYRAQLRRAQESLQAVIERQVLAGEELEVSWNLTLAANLISADVPYGKIPQIEALEGVASVTLETRYDPCVVDRSQTADPNMATSPEMIGTAAVYATGYTGAGSRIAVIDTGTDTDHQSFSNEGFQYSLAHQAGKAGMEIDEYLNAIDLLDVQEIEAVLDQLHVSERGTYTAQELYVSSKLPFGFNYIDSDLDIVHDNDSMSEHGSHVAGIAAANAYIPNEDGSFDLALEEVYVQGVAPDAQIITLKVFGKNGGAYSSDYMAAMEDAIVLGCDAINLSLGSNQPGFAAIDSVYEGLVQGLMDSGAVISISAGNAYSWAEFAYSGGYLYGDDVNQHTGGSPGTWPISMAVASAENIGFTRSYFNVGDSNVFYTESQYSNEPLATALSGEVEYIYLEIPGGIRDFEDIADVVQGRIVVCPRGGDSSFWEKATGAVMSGAIGTIIYNDRPGIVYMNLGYYPYTEPCVAITQADGALLKENGTEYVHECGITYSIGKLSVNGLIGTSFNEDTSVIMSDFSSWGVPGDLTMKPEITAPGGDIYSVFGSTPDGGGSEMYESMSGTSMAAPQIAGMAALMAQYIRENGLEEKTGLSARQLSHSLLMSTAVPIREMSNNGLYYSILNQGSGLANVGAAVSADSYILMDESANATAADGKVKVELGYDAERKGEYTFSFTLNNLTDQAQTYELSADFFTQALAEGIVDEETSMLILDKVTTPLNTTVTWQVDGKTLTPNGSVQGLDFDGDGDVDELDGQALLDYATGVRGDITNGDAADLDADGDIDSYDAYLFFGRYSAGTMTLPANGESSVTVTVALTGEQKAFLDQYYADGAYVEGFVYVNALASQDGAMGTSHSIPVLGFYGDWSDPSMFEVGSYSAYRTGDETRAPYSGDTQTNNISVSYGDTPGKLFYYGGNFVVADETYHPERNAINSENGDMIGRAFFSPIRNAAASRFTITDQANGKTLYETYPGAAAGSYYHYSAGAWINTNQYIKLNWAPKGMEEGDSFLMELTLAPETHVAADGSVDWDSLGRGASISMPMTIDNTAPTLEEVTLSLTGNELVVTASDNQYVAGAVLFDGSGNYILRRAGSVEDIQPGQSGEYRLSLEGINGTKFMLQVVDYAYNITTYMIEQDVGEAAEIPQFIAFVYKPFSWVSFSEEAPADYTFWKATEERIYAATMVDNMVYYSTINGNLGVFNAEANYEEYFIRNLGWYPGDMAYNPVDGYIYAVVNINKYSLKDPIIYSLLRIDKMTGEISVAGTTPVLTNSLAIDGEGNFYCNKYETGEIVTFTLDDLSTATPVCTISESSWPLSLQAMEWDYNIDALRWPVYHQLGWDCYTGLVTVDVDTGTYTYKEAGLESYTGLAIPTKGAKTGSWASITDQISTIELNHTEETMFMRSELRLDANVLPWTVSDRSVAWSSSDPSVATVDGYGNVTAVSTGEAVITAASRLDPTVTSTCHVTVVPVEMTVTGVTQDPAGGSKFFSWDMETQQTAELGVELDTSILSATDIPGSDSIYAVDDADGVWKFHKIDKATGATIATPDSERFRNPLMDLAFNSCYTTLDGADRVSAVYQAYIFPSLDPMDPNEILVGDMTARLSARGATRFIAVASAGMTKYMGYDAEQLYMVDDKGNMWDFKVYNSSNGKMYINSLFRATNLLEAGMELSSMDSDTISYSSMVVGDDGALYLSVYNGLTCDLFRLTYQSKSKTFDAKRIGAIGNGPTALLTAGSNQPAQAPETVDPELYELIPVTELTGQPAGMVNSAAVRETEEQTDTVTVTVTADEASTNGIITLDYDAELLTLDSVHVNGDYRSILESDGTVTFGYVNLAGFASEETVASVTFTVNACGAGQTQVTVTHSQRNNDHPAASQLLTIDCGHQPELRDAVDATCTEDGYTGDSYCARCGSLLAEGETVPAFCPSAAYQDLDTSAWYHEYTDFVIGSGLMNGVSGDAFAPGAQMTRAQIVTVLYRMAGAPEVSEAASFTDVSANAWYADAVAWAQAKGIAKGVSADRFEPDAALTRQQLVTFFARYAALAGLDTTASGDLSGFADGTGVDAYARDAMIWAVEAGLIEGMGDGTIAPDGTATRAQAAAIVTRLSKLID